MADGISSSSTGGSEKDTSTYEDEDDGLICPVCHEIISEAFITFCGHSYCFACITTHLDRQSDCPVCRTPLTRDNIFPNFQLNRAAELRVRKGGDMTPNATNNDGARRYIDHLPYNELVALLTSAVAKRKHVELWKENIKTRLLYYFLNELEGNNMQAIVNLQQQLETIQQDLRTVSAAMYHIDNEAAKDARSGAAMVAAAALTSTAASNDSANTSAMDQSVSSAEERGADARGNDIKTEVDDNVPEACRETLPAAISSASDTGTTTCWPIDALPAPATSTIDTSTSHTHDIAAIGTSDAIAQDTQPQNDMDASNLSELRTSFMSEAWRKRKFKIVVESNQEQQERPPKAQKTSSSTEPDAVSYIDKRLAPLKSRVDQHFEDFTTMYWSLRDQDLGIETFASSLYDLTRYSRFEELDTIFYTDVATNNAIVSSIEFDKDQEHMAVGGVSRDIKLFDFGLVADRVDTELSGTPALARIHCPLKVIKTEHKISCLSWNPYIKSRIASSDYEGLVNLWDAATGQNVRVFDEHKRRAWSIDTCPMNPTLMASGSDDSTVKIWSINAGQSVHTLEQRGNVCCAKFAPTNNYHLAIGSADHHVTCYDLRFAKQPFETFSGHDKAVSYVKWLDGNQIISASTDSTLKLWQLGKQGCVRTYRGHTNEKNFVGLSLNHDWIACGSENNTFYAYHKDGRFPLASYQFPTVHPLTGQETYDEETSLFVSSVCWKQDSMKIAVANSKGMIKILQLVE
ncbi:WD40-repeat-containing domain protein [Gongronella butleri]|nr:WD40-repeat-containing domain protein [Gongronella butleri]